MMKENSSYKKLKKHLEFIMFSKDEEAITNTEAGIQYVVYEDLSRRKRTHELTSGPDDDKVKDEIYTFRNLRSSGTWLTF